MSCATSGYVYVPGMMGQNDYVPLPGMMGQNDYSMYLVYSNIFFECH